MINFDIEDAARRLRRAKGEALAAIDKLEDLEIRHWALLRQYEADQTLVDNTEIKKNGSYTESKKNGNNGYVAENNNSDANMKDMNVIKDRSK